MRANFLGGVVFLEEDGETSNSQHRTLNIERWEESNHEIREKHEKGRESEDDDEDEDESDYEGAESLP